MGEETATEPAGSGSATPLLIPGVVVSERYELVRQLGRGAAGVVWLATHQLLASDVAVKFLDASSVDFDDPTFLVERFRFEAQVSARLAKRTDRIVAVHDGGVFQGMPFIVMDLCEGSSVEALVDGEGLSVDDAVVLAHQVAEALDACHAESIAHRDVKPANILAVETPSGREFKLADFGVAKLFGAAPKGVLAPRATAEQSLVGSPAYMSPEAISGDRTTSGAGDVWSLAVTLYEALTRALPFQGDGNWTSVAVAIVSRRYVPVSMVLGPAAETLDRLFARAFAHALEDRFASASDLARAFEDAAKPLQHGTYATGTVEPPASLAAREAPLRIDEDAAERPPQRSSTIWLGAAAALLLLLGATVLLLRGPEPTAAARNAEASSTPPPSPSEHAIQTESRAIDISALPDDSTRPVRASDPRITPRASSAPSAPPSTSQARTAEAAATAPTPATATPTAAPRPTSRPIDPSEIQ